MSGESLSRLYERLLPGRCADNEGLGGELTVTPEQPPREGPSPDQERMLVEAAQQVAAQLRPSSSEAVTFRLGQGDFQGYDILRELHRGGQGLVYEALQRSTHRKVAIKVILGGSSASEAAQARFEREVRLLASLKHPNIVVIHDSGLSQGCRYFVMDLVLGQHIHEYCRSRALGVFETVRLFRQVVDAVAFAHGRDIVHRDLKPSNILVAEDGIPYVLDFGLAKVTGRMQGESLAAPLSIAGEVLGTLRYMSPEQVGGKLDAVDARTDVHGLGIILYELLAGSHPFDASAGLSRMLQTIRSVDPPAPSRFRPDLDSGLEGIILKALCKEPDRRFPSALEMRQAVDAWLGEQESGSGTPEKASAVRRNTTYKRGLVLAGSLALLTVVLVATNSWRYLHQTGKNEQDPQPAYLRPGSSQAGIPPARTTQPTLDTIPEQSSTLLYVKRNLPLRGLRVQSVPGEDTVRIEGCLLNEAELQILRGRLASIKGKVQLEAKVDPEALRLLIQKALTDAGGRDVRVRLEGRNGAKSLNVQFSGQGASPKLEALAREFVFDKAVIRFRAY